jgi:hypothetical protein
MTELRLNLRATVKFKATSAAEKTKLSVKKYFFYFQNKRIQKIMNRFESVSAALIEGEAIVTRHDGVKLYNGHEKVRC